MSPFWSQVAMTLAVAGGAFLLFFIGLSYAKYERMMREAHGISPADHARLCIARRLQVGSGAGAFFILRIQRPDLPEAGALPEQYPSSLFRMTDDVIVLDAWNWVAVVDAPEAQAAGIVDRIRTALTDAGQQAARMAVATIPGDGLNGQQVLEATARRLGTLGPGADALPDLPAVPAEEAGPMPAEQRVLDPETGVLRPDMAVPMARKFISRAHRRTRPAVLILLKLDKMDRITLANGEDCASAMRKAIAETLEQGTREADLLGRSDHNDFFVLAECGKADGLRLANRLCGQAARLSIAAGRLQIRPVVFAGLAACPDHATSPARLFACAEEACLHARDAGAGECTVFDPARPRRASRAAPAAKAKAADTEWGERW